jgi:hypothetical protein
MTSTASVARLPLERGPVALIEECLRVLTFLLPQGFQGHRFPARDLTACARRTSSPILPNLGFRHAPVTAARMERAPSTISETVVRQNVARLKSRSPWAGLQNWTPRQPRTALSRRRDSFDGRVVGDGGAYTIFNQHRACNKILR